VHYVQSGKLQVFSVGSSSPRESREALRPSSTSLNHFSLLSVWLAKSLSKADAKFLLD